LLSGWNENKNPVIWFEGPDLAPLCCLAWLMAMGSQSHKKQKKDKDLPAYSGLIKIASKKRPERVVESLQSG